MKRVPRGYNISVGTDSGFEKFMYYITDKKSALLIGFVSKYVQSR